MRLNGIEKDLNRQKSIMLYVGSTLEELIRSAGLKEEQILGVGIGLPALVDKGQLRVFFTARSSI